MWVRRGPGVPAAGNSGRTLGATGASPKYDGVVPDAWFGNK